MSSSVVSGVRSPGSVDAKGAILLKNPISVLILLLLLSAITQGAAAGEVSISFSDLDPLTNAEFWLYEFDDTTKQMSLLQRVNLNDSITLTDNTSYVMVYRPTETSWFSDPWSTIDILFISLPKVILIGVFVAAFFAVIYIFYRASTGGGR